MPFLQTYVDKKWVLWRRINKGQGWDTFMISVTGYFIIIHRDMGMKKALLRKFSSVKYNIMILNSKNSKVVSFIQDSKAWYRWYVI